LVQAIPIPYLKAFPIADTICQGQTLLISAYTNDTLTWQPLTGISCATCDTTFVSPLITTNYIASAKNSYGCIIIDTVIVKVITPLKLNILPNDTSICPKQFVQFNNNLNAIYNWQPNTYLSAINIANPSAVVDSSIVYTVIATDSTGCFSDTALVRINTFAPATVNAGNDTIINYNSNFTLQPTLSNNIANIIWTPLTNNLNCSFCTNPSGTALFSTMYYVNVTSNNGCTANDSVKITVNCNANNLFVPSAFTPNNDGLNDYFYPMGRGYKIINSFVIYNRWGQKLFEKNNFLPNNWQLGWNGFYKGNKITDTQGLVWHITATCDVGQQVNKKGTVLLLQ
jgi:gliding motility-associated-like protein